MLYGVDVASWQGVPDWSELSRSGHRFMLTKVTGEGSYVNLLWPDNFDRAFRAGLVPGSYDWVEPQRPAPADSAAAAGGNAARDYWRTLGVRSQYCLIAVDFETPEWDAGPFGKNIEPFMRSYLYTLASLAKRPVLLYTGEYFLSATGAGKWDWLGRDFLLWLAAPGAGMLPDAAPWPDAPAPFAGVTIHQYQWHATGAGVRGEYDRNRTRLTFSQLSAIASGNGEVHVIEPTAGKYGAYVNDAGETIFVWNAGGKTRRVLGIDVRDIGVTVESYTEPETVQESISIQNQSVTAWHESRKGAQS